MILKTNYFLFIFLLFPIFCFCNLEKKIEQIAQTYIKEHDVTGLIVSVVDQNFEKTINLGQISKRSSIKVNEHTYFPLGPLTELFTAAVLAYFVEEGRVRLDDPISKFFPKSFQMPKYEEKEITLGDLATHTSGLPTLLDSLVNPKAFGSTPMYHFLKHYQLKRAPGSKYEHSYLGYALLANLLSRIAKNSFSEVLKQLILKPLDLEETTFSLPYRNKFLYAIGYENDKGVPPFDERRASSIFDGALGLYSTNDNLLKFLSFNLGKKRTSLNTIRSTMHGSYHGRGLGWKISDLDLGQTKPFFSLNRSFWGFTCYVGMVPELNCAVVIIANKAEVELSSLGEKILNLQYKHH